MGDDSPSYQRRQALRQADSGNTIRVLDSYPLSKYFDISQRLLDSFQKAVDGRRLDEAYVFGLRFANFGVEALPKHKDWRKPINATQKRRNAKQVEKVISMMETIKQRMDAEELILQEQRRAEEEERRKEASEEQRRREVEEQKAREEQLQKAREQRAEEEKNVEQSAMAKLLAMQSKISAPEPAKAAKSNEKAAAKESNQKEPSPPNRKTTTSTQSQSQKAEEKKTETSQSSRPVAPTYDISAHTEASFADPQNKSSSHKANNPRILPRQTTPRSSKEQKTIDLLQNTIHIQEKRLVQIESTQIPALVRLAKGYLNQEEARRDEALKCVARKRALERQVDVIKAAIFNMETQVFMLENAMEDRQVQKALEEASHAMKGLQESVGDSEALTLNLTNMAESMPSTMLAEDDDEELLEELQSWITPGQMKLQQDDDEASILSMPKVPFASLSTASSEPQEEEASSIGKLLKAVLG